MSRSLILAFLMALIFHSLLAWVELDVFKGSQRIKRPPEPLTIEVLRLAPMKKRAPVKKAPLVVRRPTVKGPSKTKLTPDKRVELRDEPRKAIKPEKKSMPREKQPTEDETVAPVESVDYVSIEDVHLEEYGAFVPDMVDIPMAPPLVEFTPGRIAERALQGSTSAPPIASAMPNYKENTPPPYPLLARRRNYEGEVLLEVLVTREGTVGSVRLIKSSGYEILDRAAMKGIRMWLFHPGKRGGEAIEMWVKVPIRFQLKQRADPF